MMERIVALFAPVAVSSKTKDRSQAAQTMDLRFLAWLETNIWLQWNLAPYKKHTISHGGKYVTTRLQVYPRQW